MEWTLRLVGTGLNGQSRSLGVMAISRPDGIGEVANLGVTLDEAKLLLAKVQQQVVAAQAHHHAMFRPDCQSCGRPYHAKGWRPHRIATLFGEVRVELPRLACAGCGCGDTGVSWPSHCRSTPGLDELQARLSALMPYRVATDVMLYLLPREEPRDIAQSCAAGRQAAQRCRGREATGRRNGNHGQLRFNFHTGP
jgi:hypothetical protein